MAAHLLRATGDSAGEIQNLRMPMYDLPTVLAYLNDLEAYPEKIGATQTSGYGSARATLAPVSLKKTPRQSRGTKTIGVQ